MNKTQLVEAIAAESGLDKNKVAEVLRAFEEVVVGNVSKGDKIVLSGFLSFERVERKARTARNPQTGEAIQVKASRAPKVSIGSAFKENVRGIAQLERAAPRLQPPSQLHLASTSFGDAPVEIIDFDIQGRPGHLVSLADSNYLNIELHDGFCSFEWTSDLDLEQSYAVVQGVFPESESPDIVVYSDQHERSEFNVDDFEQRLPVAMEEITSMRVAFDTKSFTWERSRSRLTMEGKMGFISHSYDESEIQYLLRATGTPQIVEHVSELLRACAYLEDRLNFDVAVIETTSALDLGSFNNLYNDREEYEPPPPSATP